MTEETLIIGFIQKKNDYGKLGIQNLWAAHLLNLAAKYPKYRPLINEALGDPMKDFGKPKDTTKKTIFVERGSPVEKISTGECEGCVEARRLLIIKNDPTLQPSEQPVEEMTLEQIKSQYPTREAASRAAIQLGIAVKPNWAVEKIHEQIYKNWND